MSEHDRHSTLPSAATRPSLDELGSYIRLQRAAARLSLRQLAKRAGVSNPYLSQIERGLRKPSAEILQAIARALRITAETLYAKAGILDEPPDPADPEAVIARDPYLTDQQRQALIEAYRSFRRLGELRDEAAGGGRAPEPTPTGPAAVDESKAGSSPEGAPD